MWNPLGELGAVLQGKSPDTVTQLSTLFDMAGAQFVLCRWVLLLKRSDGDEIDVGVLCRFIDRKSIILFAFVAIAVPGNDVRWYQLYLVPQLSELMSPVVCRVTGLHVNHGLRVVSDKLPRLIRVYSFIYQRLAIFTKDSDLKDVFGKIYRDGGSIVYGMGSLGCADLLL